MPQKEHNPVYHIITIFVKRTYKNKTKNKNKTTKNFQNLLALEGSFSINILSKNTLPFA